MTRLSEAWIAIQDFFEAGGPVLIGIALLTFALWSLIIERFLYRRGGHPAEVARVSALWRQRSDTTSWYAQQILRSLVSQVSAGCHRFVGSIQTLVALCPLLGLLGTVTGMMEVFEVMALTGSGNARAMAAGVSKATIPTMAGMVAALSGLYFSVSIKRWADDETERVADLLVAGEA